MIQDEQVTTKQLKELTPISRVIFRALMEEPYANAFTSHVVDFLVEAQDVWKNKHADKAYNHPGAYYLGRTYQALEAAEIIGPEGQIWNPATMVLPGRINGRLCRPRGFAAIYYEKTKTFKNFIVSLDRANAKKSR